MTHLIDVIKRTTWQTMRGGSSTRESLGQVDVIFFGFCVEPGTTAEALRAAIAEHKGEWCEVNVFDGELHSYIELGGWIGDQGAALRFIGLGAVLGLWKLVTPVTLFGDALEPHMVGNLAGQGYLGLRAERSPASS